MGILVVWVDGIVYGYFVVSSPDDVAVIIWDIKRYENDEYGAFPENLTYDIHPVTMYPVIFDLI